MVALVYSGLVEILKKTFVKYCRQEISVGYDWRIGERFVLVRYRKYFSDSNKLAKICCQQASKRCVKMHLWMYDMFNMQNK